MVEFEFVVLVHAQYSQYVVGQLSGSPFGREKNEACLSGVAGVH